MIKKEYFLIKENDVGDFKAGVDVFKDKLLMLIDEKPAMSVKSFIEWEESLANPFDEIITKYSFLFSADQRPEVIQSYNEMVKYSQEKLSDLNYNKEYYGFIKTLKVEDEQDSILKDKMLKDFEDRGLNLPKNKQDELIQISKDLTDASVSFTQNIASARKEWSFVLDEANFNTLTEQQKSLFNEDRTLKFNINHIFELLEVCENEKIRDSLFSKYNEIANKGTEHDNFDVITKIVELKQKRAHILSKANVCELVLEDTMAKDIDSALGFVMELNERVMPAAEREHDELVSFAQEKLGVSEVKRSSLSFYAQKMKEDLFSYVKDEERQYLPADKSLNAAFGLIKEMFNITFEKVENGFGFDNINVDTYKIFNNGEDKGYFILDLFEREAKKGGAWVSNYLAPTKDKEGILALSANFDKSKEGLSFDDLTTLLHEFGHLVHAISSQTKYRSYSGTNGVPRDAVEIPSQMLEKFAQEPFFLKAISDNKIPDELIEKAHQLNKFRSATFYSRQIGFALYDLEVYQGKGEDLVSLFKECVDKTGPIKGNPDSNFPMVFSHIFSGGYSSGYYGYLWSDVYSVDAFSFIKGDRAELGRQFKDKVLAHGSAYPAKDLYLDFKGEDANMDNFLAFYDLVVEQPKKKMKMR